MSPSRSRSPSLTGRGAARSALSGAVEREHRYSGVKDSLTTRGAPAGGIDLSQPSPDLGTRNGGFLRARER